ncbi:MAG TPA: DUF1552 domain-containing protein [Polyangiaceae bacterium]
MSARGIHRRALLTGLGGSVATMAIARSLLGDFRPRVRPPRRLILLMQNNGTQQGAFWPSPGGPFTSPILAPLLSDPGVASKTTLVRGVFVPHDANGTNGNEHDIGFARMFTGAKLMSVGNQPWGGAASVDQVVARAWGVDSLALAILASAVEPQPKPGFDHRRSFSYVGPAQHKLPTLDPFEAYARLFSDGSGPPDAAARQQLLLRRSALDAVAGNLQEVQSRLGPAERAKLDVHLTSVRQLEQGLARSLDGQASPGATCARKPGVVPTDYRDTAPQLLLNDESAIPQLVTSMLDLIASAIGCGITRVATLQLGYCGGKWKFAWEGMGFDYHGNVAHRDTSDAGSSPQNTMCAVAANRYFATQVAYLARKLDAMPDGDGTVLDNTLLVWANEFGRGDHSLNNVPIVLVGKAGGGLPDGGRLVDVGPQTFQRLGCTVLRAVGLGADGFGDEPACGPLQGI